jgi:hypothetical protein
MDGAELAITKGFRKKKCNPQTKIVSLKVKRLSNF